MPARYEIVDEPESLEIIDDVYRGDLTIEDNAESTRSLEPIFPGAVGFRTVFYDPRWTPGQRKCCIGLYMVPDLESHDITFLFYSPFDNTISYDKYVSEIDDYLQVYRNYSREVIHKTCSNGDSCGFDLSWLGDNCTRANQYGFLTGNPCILFVLRNVHYWQPELNDTLKRLMTTVGSDRSFDSNHLPLTCRATVMSDGVETWDNMKYYPEAGFNITSFRGSDRSGLPPLVFLQLLEPHRMPELHFRCQIVADNIGSLLGIHTVEFEYSNPKIESYSMKND
ncbi:unnamed protein product [Soboliphyme baturini]|uniref:Sodium/potassium-transporting ATPase subunit beta n=1 Tax=Soboliphyme baturini TaxID=241478 RepID=A0A183ID95_9BILA|nr:unnamed protein product [Soboliphyme baturini]